MVDSGWRRVVFTVDFGEDGAGLCPECGKGITDCECPGPTEEGMGYRVINGRLMARPLENPNNERDT
jgi:hypothetical protein